jgi:hypothetical protein
MVRATLLVLFSLVSLDTAQADLPRKGSGSRIPDRLPPSGPLALTVIRESDTTDYISCAAVVDSSGRIWVAYAEKDTSQPPNADSLRLSSSTDGGVTWIHYPAFAADTGSFVRGELDLELLETPASTFVFAVAGLKNSPGRLFRWAISGTSSAYIDLPFSILNIRVGYSRPRMTSTRRVPGASPALFISVAVDSLLPDNSHSMATRLFTVPDPFAPLGSGYFTTAQPTPAAGGIIRWYRTSNISIPIAHDIGFFNNGINDVLMTVFSPEDEFGKIYFAWSTNGGQSIAGTFFLTRNLPVRSLSLDYTGGSGVTTGMLVFTELFSVMLGDYDVQSLFTSQGGTAPGEWTPLPVDLRTGFQGDARVIAESGSPGVFHATYVNNGVGGICQFASFNGIAWGTRSMSAAPPQGIFPHSPAYATGSPTSAVAIFDVNNGAGTLHASRESLPAPTNVPIWVSAYSGTGGSGSPVARLRWSTFAEVNVVGFNIEIGSAKGGGFAELPGVTIPAVGNSTEPVVYDFELGGGGATSAWYRIRLTDALGGQAWSEATQVLPDSVSTGSIEIPVNLTPGWNLVSLPVTPDDGAPGAIFPLRTSPAYAFAPTQGYVPQSTLEAGPGFWINHPPGLVPVIGIERTADTIEVQTGWNIIGSISHPVPVPAIGSIPPGMATSDFFEYAGGMYLPAAAIEPGRAYWVKVLETGALVLSTGALPRPSRVRVQPVSDMPPQPPDGVFSGSDRSMPASFALEQNYPNPFNPETAIRFSVPNIGTRSRSPGATGQITDYGRVRLVVYDLLGRQVATLVDEEKAPGSYTVMFPARGASASGADASKLSSGMYIYRLTADGLTATRRMMLIK